MPYPYSCYADAGDGGCQQCSFKEMFADPENLWMLTAEERKKTPNDRINGYFDNYIDISFHKTLTDDPKSADQVHIYAKRILSLGCFYMEYSDAIREGDGNPCASMLEIFASHVR